MTSAGAGAFILGAPRIILIVTLALYLIPSTGAFSCYKCEYGPMSPEEAGEDLPCTKGNPPEGTQECLHYHVGCISSHWRGVKDGVKYVEGHGGCVAEHVLKKCVPSRLETEAFSEEQIDQRKCISAKVPRDQEDSLSTECLHRPDEFPSPGEDLEVDVCPCYGDLCNDGSPPRITAAAGTGIRHPPQLILMTIAAFAVTTGLLSSGPMTSRHILI